MNHVRRPWSVAQNVIQIIGLFWLMKCRTVRDFEVQKSKHRRNESRNWTRLPIIKWAVPCTNMRTNRYERSLLDLVLRFHSCTLFIYNPPISPSTHLAFIFQSIHFFTGNAIFVAKMNRQSHIFLFKQNSPINSN